MPGFDGDIKLNVDLQLKDARKRFEDLKKAAQDTLNSTDTNNLNSKTKSVAAQLKAAYTQAERIDKKLSAIEDRTVTTSEWAKATQELKDYEAELTRLQAQYKQNSSTLTPNEKKRLNTLPETIQGYKEYFKDFIPEEKATALTEPLKGQLDLLNDKIMITGQKYQQMTDKAKEAGNSVLSSTNAQAAIKPDEVSEARWSKMDSEMQSFIASYYKVINASGAAVGSVVKVASSKVIKLYKTLASAIASVAKNMAKLAAKKLSSKIFHTKSIDDYNKSLKHGIKVLLRYGLGVRSLFFLFRKLKAAFKEGLGSLVQYDDTLNKSVSSMTSAFKQLKYSLATAFAPIVNVVAPYITYLIKLMNRALDAVGMFFAALTGQKSYTKVAEIQEDYAASLRDTTKETKKAKKAAEGYLSPLDEINRLEKDKSDETGNNADSSAGGNPAQKVNYEQVPIASKFQELANKLKDFIKNEDWEGLGAWMAAGINKGLQKVYDAINWDNVGPKITKFINAITTTFNSLVDNLDWDLLGRTIAAGINTIVKSLNLLYEGIDWVNLGSKIAEGIHGFLKEIDGTAIGNLIGNKLMVIPKILYGIVTKMTKQKTFTLAGRKFGDAVNGIFEKVNLGMIGATIGKLFTGIGKFLIKSAQTIKWENIGKNIANGINKLFKNFDPITLVTGATKLISGLLTSIETVIDKTDWSVVMEKVIEFIATSGAALLATGGKIIVLAIKLIAALVEGLINAISNINWADVWNGIKDAFKSFFGINGPSKVFMEFGKDLILGLIKGIGALISGVINLFKGLKDKIVKTWDSLKEKAKDRWGKIKDVVKDKTDAVAEKTRTAWNGIKDKVRTASDAIHEKTKTVWGKIRDKIKEKTVESAKEAKKNWDALNEKTGGSWETLKYLAKTSFGNLKKRINGTWDSIKKHTKAVWEAIVDIVKKPINGIISFINAMIWGIITGLNIMIRALNHISIDIPDWVPKLGGKTLGFSIPELSIPQIPLLAQGAVIPPNKAFMAVLGDQKQGTNIEAPEALIRKIVREETQQSNNTYKIVLEVGGRQLLEAVLSEAQLKRYRSGSNPFELA